MTDIRFKERMASLLGDGCEAFFAALSGEAVRGARINPIKCKNPDAVFSAELGLEELSYVNGGYIMRAGEGVGSTPEHHAGMIYVQDPGAMATLGAIDISPDWRVLDMCSAPGGKSSQAAARLSEGGFLLSNEYVPKRAKIVVSNFERLGIKNAVVTSLDTDVLPELYSEFFDLVIADVPCSGEGMFRKSEEAVTEWSEENVLLCAERQRKILKNAPPLLKEGGYLIYSTCTYSLEENEMVIDAFLRDNPDFEIVPVKEALIEKTEPGIVFEGAYSQNLHLARRFYPHKSEGEGQFVALLKKGGSNTKKQTILYKNAAKEPSREEWAAIDKFFSENLTDRPHGRVAKVGENLVIISHGYPIPPKSVFSAGVLIGTVEKGLLFPAHQFFSAYGELFIRKINLSRGDERVAKYLRGEEIEAADKEARGWCSVFYEGAALGGGKMSSGRIKNHYPKGLRQNIK